MRREVRYAREIRREQILIEQMAWYTLPWYRKLVGTLLGMSPESL